MIIRKSYVTNFVIDKQYALFVDVKDLAYKSKEKIGL
jgi:hypothetical protein